MSWFWKRKVVAERKPEETGIDLPALNWFIHVLINNVGYNKWIRMSKEEQKKYDEEHPYNAGYPYKVITYPIPSGKDIVLKESGKYTIQCDSEYTRNLIIEMARAYDKLEKEYYYNLQEKASEKWHKIEELPPHSPASSFHERGRMFLVFSPILCYVNGGQCLGFRDGKKWYIIWNGKEIECPSITHYRLLPPNPLIKLTEYKTVKEQVEKIRNQIEK